VGCVLALLAAAELLAGLAVLGLAAPTSPPLAVLAVAVSLVTWPVAAWTLRPRGPDGVTAADALTCLRHVGAGALATSAVLVLAGALEERSWPLAILLAATIGTDALDGPVARHTGTAGPVGGRIDMEADAALFLVLSVLAAPVVGPWVLLIGLMRYLYVAAMQVRPALRFSKGGNLA
jgi:phosphatidylserine synthase